MVSSLVETAEELTMALWRVMTPLFLFTVFITFSLAAPYLNGTTRTYYVAAVEQDWDYMPTSVHVTKSIRGTHQLTWDSGMDMVNGVPIEDSPQAAAAAGQNGQRIGHVYKKSFFANTLITDLLSKPPSKRL